MFISLALAEIELSIISAIAVFGVYPTDRSAVNNNLASGINCIISTTNYFSAKVRSCFRPRFYFSLPAPQKTAEKFQVLLG